jgi:hypothetical protein
MSSSKMLLSQDYNDLDLALAVISIYLTSGQVFFSTGSFGNVRLRRHFAFFQKTSKYFLVQ